MNRLGRKNMVQISNGITAIGMLIPFVHYNLATCMTAFVLLGIGNTILQVSLNPLLTNVVKGDALTSSLTAGQVVKAVSSFCGPFIAAFAAGWATGNTSSRSSRSSRCSRPHGSCAPPSAKRPKRRRPRLSVRRSPC